MGARCSNLQNFENVCQIGDCVVNVTGVRANSSSPTDIYILELNNVKYLNRSVRKAFVKLAVSSDSYMTARQFDYKLNTPSLKNTLSSLKGLEYEFLVYSNITKRLIDQEVCPFFVSIYGVAYNCNYEKVYNILRKATTDAGVPVSDVELRFKRNIRDALTKKTRGAINDMDPLEPGLGSIDSMAMLRFNMLVSEFMYPARTNKFENHPFDQLYVIDWTYLFQVAVACYALECSKTAHNDLHDGNVFLVDLNDMVTFTMVVQETAYTVSTDKRVALYDFDRAYCTMLGDNPFLSPTFYSQNNYVGKSKDFMKFMGYVYKKSQADDQDRILQLFTTSQASQIELRLTWDRSMYLQDSSSVNHPQSWYEQFDDMPTIIHRIAQYGYFDITDDLSTVSPDYVLDSRYFSSKGLLYTQQMNEKINTEVVNTKLQKMLESRKNELLKRIQEIEETKNNILLLKEEQENNTQPFKKKRRF